MGKFTKMRFLILGVAAFLFVNTVHAQLTIAAENALPGNTYSEWGVNSSTDFRNVNLNGYATNISVNKGDSVHFKVDGQNGVPFTIKIYRLGYYAGNGARLKADLGSFPGLKQPAPKTHNLVSGLLDCSNWTESAKWQVPPDAVSGFYIAVLESAAGRNHIVFIVRDDASHSKLFFQANDATWQAYNGYGGNNFYNGTTGFPSGHAVRLSYNRPFFIYNSGLSAYGLGSDWYMNDAYPMIRWLERNGYDMTYTTCMDVASGAAQITNHKIFISMGHDEYWSKEQRDNVTAARDAGVNLAFFSGNEVYWKTRWESDSSGNPFRFLVCYKEGTLADGTNAEGTCGYKCDVSAPTIWTGLWRTGAAYDAPVPENALTGQISWNGFTADIKVPSDYKNYRFWRNTSIATLAPGDTATLAPSSLGYEFDFEQFPFSAPHGRITLSSTKVVNGGVLNHKMSLYKAPSGAFVFGAGTVQWAWGLDDQHFGGPNVVSKDMQQATVNLFADMGVQPVTLQSDLLPATASTDVTPPVSTIVTPPNNSSLSLNTAVTISGTATDANVVAGVEISLDGGATWQLATGTNNWTYSWTPTATGNYTIKTRGYDDSGNMEDGTVASGTNVIKVTVLTAACPCHIFTTQTPSVGNTDEAQPLEVGVKFQSTQAGYVTGIRFYKSLGNTGTHTGELYAADGTRLAAATFSGETGTGWQSVSFANPVAIAANTTYVAAYFTPTGNYTGQANYYTTAVVNGPLIGLADGTDGPNGVYLYTPAPAFPVNSPGNKPNYWVDVNFSTTLSVVANAGPDQTIILPTASTTLDGSASTGAITDYTWSQISGPNTANIGTPAAVTTTVSGLIAGTYLFQLSLNAGSSTSQVTIKVLPAGSTITIFTNQVPTDPLTNEAQPLELGVKFRSSQAGFITGVRFYKTAGNGGLHVGELYGIDGTRLAQANFTSETAAGWQTVNFPAPVAISANTTYIASYFTPNGTYTGTANYFTTAVVNGPLTGLADGTDGSNGVFKYTAAPAFPSTQTLNKPNYWVDAMFTTTASPTAYAGPDQTIVLPSPLTLDGSGSSGIITDYTWTQVSGPNTSTITTPNAVTSTVTGLVAGDYVFKLSINAGSSVSQVTIHVLPAGTSVTIFTTQVPVEGTTNQAQAVELGVKFQSSADGFITGVRFYKTAGNDGTHVGELYKSDGTKLASATFNVESATGWQTVTFGAPVAITANTTYVAAYFSPNGTYTGTVNYFTAAVVNSPLTGLADGTDGPNGVFLFTGVPAFPNNSAGDKPNYWVDAIYSATASATANAGPDQVIILPTSSVNLDGSGSTGVITDYTWTQISGPNTAAIGTPTTVTTSVTGLAAGDYVFQLSINGGASTSYVKITVQPQNTAITIFTTQVPTVVTNNEGQALELGVKFRSSEAGYIQGVRFFKTTGNDGAHVGELYAADGTLLATAPITNETATGWQTVLFNAPVAILPNTTYVASYFSPNGTFIQTANFFANPLVNGPLTGLADGTDGVNGVFINSPVPAFPQYSPGNKTNYWVDALFTESSTPLPVQYESWTVTKEGTNALLKWTTSEEVNNKGFEIQRSADGASWTNISFITGAGNSQTPVNYQYLDKDLAPGTYYYRLQQVDLDGNTSNSKVLSITIDGALSLALLQNRPNPFNNTTTIIMVIPQAGNVKLTLFDQIGRPLRILMDANQLPGTYQVLLSKETLSAGIYYYRLDTKGQTIVKKMTIF